MESDVEENMDYNRPVVFYDSDMEDNKLREVTAILEEEDQSQSVVGAVSAVVQLIGNANITISHGRS